MRFDCTQYKEKDPDTRTYFVLDWVDDVREGETLSATTWYVPAGITKISEALNGTVSTVWLSGGTAGQNYECVCRAVYDNSRTEDWTLVVQVKQS